jgi:P-type conjugative transfer protein TrbJ
MRRRNHLASALLVLTCLASGALLPRWGYAVFGVGDIVFDPTNLVQNTLTAFRTLQATLNQARQIANEVTMIANQVTQLHNEARNLASSPVSLLGTLTGSLEQYTSTLRDAEGMTYHLGSLTTQFNTVYPTFGQPAVSSATLVSQATQWSQQVRAALQGAMQAQSIVGRLTQLQGRLQTAMGASQAATGNLQVSQATNQLLGLMAEQTASLQQIVAASGRAEASLIAAQAASDDAARANAKHFMQGFTDYTPGKGPGLPKLRD